MAFDLILDGVQDFSADTGLVADTLDPSNGVFENVHGPDASAAAS